MQSAVDKQFKLNDEGRVLFQPDASNPMPGDSVARVVKGSLPLSPAIEAAEGTDSAALERLEAWLKTYVAHVLEPLVKLAEETDSLPAPVQGICKKLHEAMGIIPREQIEDLIGALDSEMRQHLRNRKVRLGPVLVFLPDLNKPAAVRLRGLLWALWNDKPLPAGVPADGMVSKRVEMEQIDPAFYQSIGYPVYGPRAVRIDMLDRVISAVYDSAKDGQFQARHDMAEWLGCSIDDLYAVLTAMGHRKIEPVVAAEPIPEPPAENSAEAQQAEPQQEAATPPAAAVNVKPPLAFFRLKKGKAHQKPAERKPFVRPQAESRKDKPRPQAKHKPKPAHKPKPEPRVLEARSKIVQDSPFAVLEQLKAKRDGKA